jgi:hypothetical protein
LAAVRTDQKATSVATSCGSTPLSRASYQYNGDDERTVTTTSTSSTDSTWDNVSPGSIPLNVNDATTTSSGTTNTSYLYGNLLFGGSAPIEQISGLTATFLVTFGLAHHPSREKTFSVFCCIRTPRAGYGRFEPTYHLSHAYGVEVMGFEPTASTLRT